MSKDWVLFFQLSLSLLTDYRATEADKGAQDLSLSDRVRLRPGHSEGQAFPLSLLVRTVYTVSVARGEVSHVTSPILFSTTMIMFYL